MLSSKYRILLLTILFSITLNVSAADKKKEVAIKIPLYQGVQVGFDLLPTIQSLVSTSYGAAVNADVNLKNKYFPTIELGFANFDKTSDSGNHFTSTGQYFKIGVNKALSTNGLKAENLFFIGAHYGFSAFSYDLDNLKYIQNYWGNDVTSFKNQNSVAGWIELVAGVRVKVIGPISLGWTAQYKATLHVSNGENSIPAFIPGYGSNVKPNAGMAFHLYYKLPF